MTDDDDTRVGLARVEARLDGIKNQIDHQDRTQQQLVRLFEERITQRFDQVERRLEDMEASRNEARRDAVRERDAIEARFREIEEHAEERQRAIDSRLAARHALVDDRLNALDKFNARLVGVAVAVSALTGVITFAVDKAVGS